MRIELIQPDIRLCMFALAEAMIHQDDSGVGRNRDRREKVPDDCGADREEGAPTVALRA